MKSLKESIFNNVNDIASNDTVLIEQFLKDNYEIDGTYKIDGDVVDVKGDVEVKNKKIESLTNGLFRFGVVSKDFDCAFCPGLVSLEGAPEEVGGRFYCYECAKLKSLEGGPRKVGKDFYCTDCPELESLEGAPEEVGGSFWCSRCPSLTSLEGGPRKVGKDFYCHDCQLLKITNSDRKKYRIEL